MKGICMAHLGLGLIHGPCCRRFSLDCRPAGGEQIYQGKCWFSLPAPLSILLGGVRLILQYFLIALNSPLFFTFYFELLWDKKRVSRKFEVREIEFVRRFFKCLETFVSHSAILTFDQWPHGFLYWEENKASSVCFLVLPWSLQDSLSLKICLFYFTTSDGV